MEVNGKVKNSRIMSIISLSLLAGSVLFFLLMGALPGTTPDVFYVMLFFCGIAMQIASLVLSIIALRLHVSALPIVALVLSVLVIVLEILFVAVTVWIVVSACNAAVAYMEGPEFQEMMDGCASMGFIIGK